MKMNQFSRFKIQRKEKIKVFSLVKSFSIDFFLMPDDDGEEKSFF